jgi:hypothetical protein
MICSSARETQAAGRGVMWQYIPHGIQPVMIEGRRQSPIVFGIVL